MPRMKSKFIIHGDCLRIFNNKTREFIIFFSVLIGNTGGHFEENKTELSEYQFVSVFKCMYHSQLVFKKMTRETIDIIDI